jgi:hypothetical protein
LSKSFTVLVPLGEKNKSSKVRYRYLHYLRRPVCSPEPAKPRPIGHLELVHLLQQQVDRAAGKIVADDDVRIDFLKLINTTE